MTSTRRRSTPYARREQVRGRLRHHDGRLDQLDQLGQDRALRVGRGAQHGVQRRDRGHVERSDEVEDVLAVLAAPDAVLVLDGDDIDAPGELARRADVVVGLVLADAVVDLDRVAGCRAPE